MEGIGFYMVLLGGAVVLIGLLLRPIAQADEQHTKEDILPPSADQKNEVL
jgi:hypothetical protein